MMQSPPSRTEDLVREGGLCTISTDFNRVRYLNEANILNPLAAYPSTAVLQWVLTYNKVTLPSESFNLRVIPRVSNTALARSIAN
jgi:hypothetical protein